MSDTGEPDISGTDDTDTDTDDGTPEAPPPAGRTYTQEQVDALNTRTRKAAEKKAKRDLATSMGFDSVEAMEKAMAAQREAEEAKKDELTRAREKADADMAEAARVKAEAEEAKLRADLQSALLRPGGDDLPGLNPARVDAALAIAIPAARAAGDDVDDVVAHAVAATRAAVPEIFGSGTPPASSSNGSPPTSPPASGKPAGAKGGASGTDAYAAGVAAYERRHGQRRKASADS